MTAPRVPPEPTGPLVGDPRGARRVLLVLAAALAVLLLARTLPAVAPSLDRVDEAWRRLAAARAGPFGLAVSRGLEVLAGAWVLLPLALVVAAALARRGRWRRLAAWVGAVGGTELAVLALKAATARPRPPGQLTATVGASFPSGHTAAAAAFALGLLLVLVPPGRRRRRLLVPATSWIVLVGWSRTWLLDHWLDDVVAGALLGAAVALGAALAAGSRAVDQSARGR